MWKQIRSLFWTWFRAPLRNGRCDLENHTEGTEDLRNTAFECHAEPIEPQHESSQQSVRPPRTVVTMMSLRHLLDELDEMFSVLRLPYSRMSWISRANLIGLRKMGTHVVYPDHLLPDGELGFHKLSTERVDQQKKLPAMFCVSWGLSRFDNAERCYPAVMLGYKIDKIPANISKMKGQHYVFAMGMKFGVSSLDDSRKELWWVAGHITVLNDGSLYVHNELIPRIHKIPVKHSGTRRAVGRSLSYTSMSWGKASMASIQEETPNDDGVEKCKTQFALAMNWWLRRNEAWSVSVNKDGERMTFSIPRELTKIFFKDRIRVTTETGRTKPIIHFVNRHKRLTNLGIIDVKEHIRGLDSFSWKDYRIRVTAPGFNGRLSTAFDLPSHEADEDMPLPGDGIDISKVGRILANLEDGVAPICA